MNTKHIELKAIAALAIAALTGPIMAATYDLDPAHTTFGFGVKHMVIATVKGQFDDFKGEFTYEADKPEAFAASAVIQVKSINTQNAKRDDHLRSPDFFDAEKFAELSFVATGLVPSGDGYTMNGKLTIKDVTKDVSIPVTLAGPITDPWGNERIGIEGSFKINRLDYGLNFSGKLESGDMIVGDTVTIDIQAEGIKRKE